ncbi:hypothetical protein KFL_012920010 [Klebsormidium nitens]|uniref:Mini-chromosome maintenance complex-binding protein n=1 Tax=Klebsormidium nitens TaxID=105231 RepID=A0A1Y1IQF2_KLENI|nr:hypothetical protein KFL_012920010 [Klebsormidium nitens]|eukprot:GAQ93090.1 hypothetical protein KFL_012920010 [Klebsormidium nitens]
MVGPATDCLANPLGCIRQLFDKAVTNGMTPQQLGSSDWGAKEFFAGEIAKLGGADMVPLLNSTSLDLLPSGTLVRFQGMVQDMFDPEYYVGAFKETPSSTWHTTKYTDVYDVPIASGPDAQVWERKLLYCVPIPGQSDWSRGTRPTSLNGPGAHREKRPRDDEEMSIAEPMLEEGEAGQESIGEQAKRQREASSSGMSNNETGGCGLLGEGMNLPLPSLLLPCLVKVYDDADAGLKLNDVAEFVGILTFDPQLAAAGSVGRGEPASGMPGEGAAGDSLDEELPPSLRLSPSKVPRLQCIYLHKLPTLVPGLPPPASLAHAAAAQELAQSASALRACAVSLLTVALGGDTLAAQYLLLTLLSKVTGRAEPMAVGKLALNLVGCPAASPPGASPLASVLRSALPALVPACHLLPLSLDLLNRAPLVPRKDYTLNRLVAAPLQLAAGTVLVVDETALQPGTASATGVRNLQALQHLVEWQKLEYDFQWYTVDVLTDVPVLALSEARSLLPADVTLPLRQTRTATWAPLPDAELVALRRYLGLARQLEHTIGEATTKAIEDDLVAARKGDPSLTSQDFHRWLTLARLTSVSYGESSLSMSRWESVREMERLRLDRLRCV